MKVNVIFFNSLKKKSHTHAHTSNEKKGETDGGSIA